MADKVIWRCIICSTDAQDQPPRRCPTCGTPASRWRMVVDRAPKPVPKAAPEREAEPQPKGGGEDEKAEVAV